MKAFLGGLLFIVGFAISSESFASFPPLPEGGSVFWSKSGQYFYWSPPGDTGSSRAALVQQGQNQIPACVAANPDKTCTVQDYIQEPVLESTDQYGNQRWSNRAYVRVVALPVVEAACPADTIPGGPIMSSGSGTYAVNQCLYACSVNYSKLDGNTTLYDARECKGLGQPAPQGVVGKVDDNACAVLASTGDCLDMSQQPNGSCPTGTTYGRVNDKEVCVPSGTPTDPLDPGSQGLPDSGGNQQAEGTPDSAGTGGSPTGTGTGTSSGGSSGTTTCTTSPEGVQTCTSTGTTETQTETTGPATFGGHGDPASWWETKYPEGAAGIASKFAADVGNGPFMAMLNPLKSLPDGGSAPSWSLDFSIGQMGNYGSQSFELPAGVWAFVRFAILFTTVMTVRKLIFGG